MLTAREIMTTSPTILDIATPITDVARTLREENIGAVVICNPEQRLQGVVTDRDIAVEVVAAGKDPQGVTAGDILSGRETVTIGADDSIDEAIQTMIDHAVRRLPVIDGTQVVGMVTQADIALNVPEERVAELVRSISAAPDNTGRG